MRPAWGRLALAACISSFFHTRVHAQASSPVKCWRVVTSSSGALTTDLAGTDGDCPVNVYFTEFSGTFAPGDDVPVMWNVLLKPAEFTTNAVKMPLPPNATLPLNADAATTKPTQIGATYVRTCSGGADTCDPSTNASAFTLPQSGNFSSTGEAVQFSSLQGLKFDAPGSYVISAMAAVRDADDVYMAYVFASYTTINITGNTSDETTNAHEKGVVRCRMTRQSALNETLDAAASVSESSNCEVGITLAPLLVTRPTQASDVTWTATLNQRDNADIHMPTPLSTEDVNGTSYQIVRSSLSVCKSEKLCDEYTLAEDLLEVKLTGPASFSSSTNSVNFTASSVALPSAGWHPAMIHLTIAGPSRRYDFVYYFELLATETDLAPSVDTATYVADGNTSYCWEVLTDGSASSVASSSVAASGQDTECPYVSALPFKTQTVEPNGTLDLSWTVTQRGSFSRTKFGSVNLTSVYDSSKQASVTLPGLHLYVCGVGTVCTPFSANKTLVWSAAVGGDLASDGKAIINAEKVTFPGSGNYTLMAHTVLPNGAGRFDVASYATVTVSTWSAAETSGSSSGSHTLTYVLVSVGSVVGVVVIFFGVVWFRKRRHRQRMDKIVRFGVFGAPPRDPMILKTTESKSSGTSDPFGHGGSFSLSRVEPSPLSFSEDREGSLSYNPYSRASFQEMSIEESNLSFAFSDGERPSVSSEVYDV